MPCCAGRRCGTSGSSASTNDVNFTSSLVQLESSGTTERAVKRAAMSGGAMIVADATTAADETTAATTAALSHLAPTPPGPHAMMTTDLARLLAAAARILSAVIRSAATRLAATHLLPRRSRPDQIHLPSWLATLRQTRSAILPQVLSQRLHQFSPRLMHLIHLARRRLPHRPLPLPRWLLRMIFSARWDPRRHQRRHPCQPPPPTTTFLALQRPALQWHPRQQQQHKLQRMQRTRLWGCSVSRHHNSR